MTSDTDENSINIKIGHKQLFPKPPMPLKPALKNGNEQPKRVETPDREQVLRERMHQNNSNVRQQSANKDNRKNQFRPRSANKHPMQQLIPVQ